MMCFAPTQPFPEGGGLSPHGTAISLPPSGEVGVGAFLLPGVVHVP